MSQDEPPSAPPELPPRPNLGPEPWPESQGPSAWWALWLGVVPAAGLAWWARRRARVRRVAAEVPGAPDVAPPGTHSDRLLALAGALRREMAGRLGPAWAAMTTEEIGQALADVEPGARGSALSLLDAADRVKFAAAEIDADHLARAESWASTARAGLAAEGARSSQNGR